jgi:hypothetical protein
LNKAKIEYKWQLFGKDPEPRWGRDMKEAIGEPPYHFIYTVFPANNRKFDLANVLPIVQKFTDDALIELGIIDDDSYKVIRAIDYRFGHVDKDNPRCELEIRSLP